MSQLSVVNAPNQPGEGVSSLEGAVNSNFTSFPEYTASAMIWRYCSPVLLVVGSFGNVATIVVYQTREWGDCTQPLFLTALAVGDLVVLYSGLVPDISYHVFDLDLRGLHDVACKLLSWVLESSSAISSWLLVAMTTQRAMSVTWPHRVSFLCSRRKSGITVFLIVLAAGGSRAHLLYGLTVHDTDVDIDGACAASEDYEQFWGSVWSWLDIGTYALLPSIFLIISNFVLVRSLRNSTKTISALAGNRDVLSRRKVASTMTATLITISALFIVLVSPIGVVVIMNNSMSERIERDQQLKAKMELVWAVTNMLWYANSAVNFFFYCLSGSRFRQEFVKCFVCRQEHSRQLNGGQTQASLKSETGFCICNRTEPVAVLSVIKLPEFADVQFS